MTATTETKERLAPIAVDCNWCEYQFLSRAKHGQKVRCPRCKHDIRVKRWGVRMSALARSGPVLTVAEPVPVALVSPPAEPTADDDDGKTYMHDEHGRLVLAEWTADGRLVPTARPTPVTVPAVSRTPQLTWADALARFGWVLDPFADDCQILAPDGVCGADATRRITGGWVCGAHHSVLCSVLNGRR